VISYATGYHDISVACLAKDRSQWAVRRFSGQFLARHAESLWPQIVRDQSIGDESAFLQEFAHQFQRGMLVSLELDQHVKDLALSVNGAPQIE
jgi:hypothetical protein